MINAVPFYTRLWRTTGGNVTSEAIGMDQAQQVISENNVKRLTGTKRLPRIMAVMILTIPAIRSGSEDSQSIAEKVKLVSKYGLAGVSAWKLGFENSGIWQVISENLN